MTGRVAGGQGAGGQVAWGTRALGFLGLLPQLAAVAAVAFGPSDWFKLPLLFAFGYGSLILSFLGGIWWGLALRRKSGQGELAALAVIPSLVPILLLAVPAFASWPAACVLLGMAIAATVLVDRHLVRTGEAPAGWLALRIPLSLGLGGLTISAGLLG